MKVVFLDRGTFPQRIRIDAPVGATQWAVFDNTTANETLQRCKDADVILTNKVVIDAEVIRQCPHLKLVAVTATGLNNIDLESCAARGISVVNASNYGTQSVAEHVIMLMLNLSRSFKAFNQANERRAWSDSPYFCDLVAPIQTLAGRTLTLVGKGTLGMAVARLAEAFNMAVLFAEHEDAGTVRSGYTPFSEAFRAADYISLHCPLNAKTHHIIRQQTLALMKPTAFLINTGRGDLIDERALYDRLLAQRLGGAALDVASVEPPPKSSVLWQLSELPTVLVTPHVAWAADDSMNALISQVLHKIEQFIHDPEAFAAGKGPL